MVPFFPHLASERFDVDSFTVGLILAVYPFALFITSLALVAISSK